MLVRTNSDNRSLSIRLQSVIRYTSQSRFPKSLKRRWAFTPFVLSQVNKTNSPPPSGSHSTKSKCPYFKNV